MPETGPFVWHELRVPDLEEAERFYGAAFGWAFADNPMIGGASAAEVGLDAHRTPYIACADVDAAAARAAAAGGIVTTGQPADDRPATVGRHGRPGARGVRRRPRRYPPAARGHPGPGR